MQTPPTVLYVEDDFHSCIVMKMLLGVLLKLPNLYIFADSRNFTKRVEMLSPKPSVVFLDIHVRPANGFEMLAMLRHLDWGKDIPIVAITAIGTNEGTQLLRTAGFNGCLSKPLDLPSFRETFHRITLGESVWRTIGS